jgi:hypothetical protein
VHMGQGVGVRGWRAGRRPANTYTPVSAATIFSA